jgi:hypothetical protein
MTRLPGNRGVSRDPDDLITALRIAAARGWLVLPDIGVDGFVRTHGEVLRYDTSVDPRLVAQKVRTVLTSAAPTAPTRRK